MALAEDVLLFVLVLSLLHVGECIPCKCSNSHPCNSTSSHCNGWFCHYDSTSRLLLQGCSNQPRQREVIVNYNQNQSANSFTLTVNNYCHTAYCNSEQTHELNPYMKCKWEEPPQAMDVKCHCNRKGMLAVGGDPDLCIQGFCTLGASYRPLNQGFGYCFLKYAADGNLLMGCNPLKRKRNIKTVFSLVEGDQIQCALHRCNSLASSKWGHCPSDTQLSSYAHNTCISGLLMLILYLPHLVLY